MTRYIDSYTSPLGDIVLASDGEHLTGLWFAGQTYFPDLRDCTQQRVPVLQQTRQWLDCYFGGSRPDVTPPLAPEGTPFRRDVWTLLLQIPYGTTCTYGDIARALAKQRGLEHMSAHAVGGAVAHNPISIIIPCHRVVGSTGSLTGYAGGIDRKIKLLTLEGTDMRGLFAPRRTNA